MHKFLNTEYFYFIVVALFAFLISSGYLSDINILFSFDHYTIKEYFLINEEGTNLNKHFNLGISAYGNSLISTYYKLIQLITFNLF